MAEKPLASNEYRPENRRSGFDFRIMLVFFGILLIAVALTPPRSTEDGVKEALKSYGQMKTILMPTRELDVVRKRCAKADKHARSAVIEKDNAMALYNLCCDAKQMCRVVKYPLHRKHVPVRSFKGRTVFFSANICQGTGITRQP